MCLLLDLCTTVSFIIIIIIIIITVKFTCNFTLNVSPNFNFKAYFETILFSPSHEATCSLYAAVSAASTPAMDIWIYTITHKEVKTNPKFDNIQLQTTRL